MSRKLSYSRTKSGCICWQQLTAEWALDAVSTSHWWLCRKDCNSARLGEIKSTSKMAGFMLPSLWVRNWRRAHRSSRDTTNFGWIGLACDLQSLCSEAPRLRFLGTRKNMPVRQAYPLLSEFQNGNQRK